MIYRGDIMADKDEWDYVSTHYSEQELDKWVKNNEPWRLEKEVLPEPIKEPKKTHTEQELYDMNKNEQIDILKRHGIKDIPKHEKERVDKILELMMEGGD